MLRTVFIVGAGASTEFGLGAGAALASEIPQLLREKFSRVDEIGHPFDDAVRALNAPYDELAQSANTIRRGIHFSNSIDDFLHDNRDNELVVRLGKLCIAYCMLLQERKAHWLQQLNVSDLEIRAHAFENLKGTWIDALFRLLRRGHTRAEAREAIQNSAFIVFNYDRCIEQYLHAAVADAFDLEPSDANVVVESIQIEHVYGSLGPLPAGRSPGYVDFASTSPSITTVAQGIKTYTEETSGASRQVIQNMLGSAEQIAFLGYAFHEQGMNLLFPDEIPKFKRVFWTQHGVHDAVVDRLASRVPNQSRRGANATCVSAIARWQFDLMAD